MMAAVMIAAELPADEGVCNTTGEAWFVPGWMRTTKPEELAWTSFTNVFSASECVFRKWDGNCLWPDAVDNADGEAAKLADEIKAMPPERRARLTLVGHSLGGRMTARVLARLGRDGIKIKRGILLAPAIPANDHDLKSMGSGSAEPLIVIANPDDITLKYVYTIAGGEEAPAYGASTGTETPKNVKEHPVAEDITSTTAIDAFWGRFDAAKEIANHHASFYFEELGRVLDGTKSKGARILVPQDKINFEWKVMDAEIWWDVIDKAKGWKLERNVVTGHCRILDPTKTRNAWGSEEVMRKAFDKVKTQLKD